MSDKINMSLEDIIKKNKVKKGKQNKTKTHVKDKSKGFNKKAKDRNAPKNLKKFGKNKPNNADRKKPANENRPKNENKPQKEKNPEKIERTKKASLFVKGLDFNMTNSQLRDLFIKIGPLKTCGINWNEMGKSKGTGTIEYQKVEDASKALKKLDGTVVLGRTLVVKYSK